MMKDNPYFNRFLWFALTNLVACAAYFVLSPLSSVMGVPRPEGIGGDLFAAAVTVIPFLLAVFVSTLLDKTLPRTPSVRAYFSEVGRADLAAFTVWAVLGALIAAVGGSAGIAVFIFIAQAIPCTLTISLFGHVFGLIAGVALNFLLFLAARLGAVLLHK